MVVKKVELFIKESNQRDLLGNNVVTHLGMKFRQKPIARSVNEVEQVVTAWGCNTLQFNVSSLNSLCKIHGLV